MAQLDLFIPAKAASHRQKKVAEEIRHHLAAALARGDLPPVRSASGSGFIDFSIPITVTHIEISPDMRHATVSITPLGGVDQENALFFVRAHRGTLRKILSAKMQLRHTPDLHFKNDATFEEADRMLKKIADVVSNDEKLAAQNTEEDSE